MAEATLREVVAAFNSRGNLEKAIDALGSAGFDRSRLSVLGNIETVERETGKKFGATEDLKDDPSAPRREPIDRAELGDAVGVTASIPAYLAAVVAAGATAASGGTLAGVAVAALAGGAGGGALGAALGKALGNRVGEDVTQKLDRGGLLLWVGVQDTEEESVAVRTLKSAHAEKIDVHEIPAET